MDVFNEKWSVMEQGIAKLKAMIAGNTKAQFTSEEYMLLYTIVYELSQEHAFSELLYEKHRQTFQDHLSLTVVPSLQDKQGSILLRDFAVSWTNHKTMAHWMARFFSSLDRVYFRSRSHPPLYEVAVNCFRDLVYSNMRGKVVDTILFLIDQERKGHEIDRALLKNAVDVFVEIGMGNMQYYVQDFEAPMLDHTSAYYSQKLSMGMILQIDECVKDEKDRVLHYLHPISEAKILKRAHCELLVIRTAQLLL